MCENTYVNIQTGVALDMSSLIGNNDNIALKVTPEIWMYWDFHKNSDVDIYTLTKGSSKKYWWYCEKCDDSYPQAMNKKVIGRGCSICRGYYCTSKNSFGGKFPELSKEWHPTKNGNLTPYDVSYGSGTKVWWKCSKCNNDYNVSIDKKTSQNAKCPYCRGLKVNFSNNLKFTHQKLVEMWDYEKNIDINPEQFVKGSKVKVYWKCKVCGDETFTMISNKSGCAVCAGQKVIKGLNDINTTDPELANLLLNSEDRYKLAKYSNVNVDWRCNICDSIIRNKKVSDVSKNRFKCPVCTDCLSFGEKVIYGLLKSLGVRFEYEKAFKWSNKRRFDFFCIDYSLIIEVHGEQHYNGSFSKVGGRTLQEEQENDNYKKNLALKNGITHYVELKSDSLDLVQLKHEIKNSSLINIFNIDDIFLEEFKIDVNNSLIHDCWHLWNNTDYGVMKIAEKLMLSKSVIRKYLLLGNELGKCKYSVNNKYDRIKRKVVKMTMNWKFIKCYDSLVAASKDIEGRLLSNSIDVNKSYKGYRWMYKDDYEKQYNKIDE